MNLITTQSSLIEFCSKISNSKFIAVDTEFMRSKTYYPILCLIQIASEDVAVAIDPLSDEIDLSPLLPIFMNDEIVKIFHSARQDIEIIYQLFGKIPVNIFDTQIAAMACGFGESVSYETLVGKLLDIKIDKTYQHSDWQARPLFEEKINYALADVTHLINIYQIIKDVLQKENKTNWIKEEIDSLIDINNYTSKPENVWKKINLHGTSQRIIPYVIKLAEWREINAQKLNIPKGHLLKDEILIYIATQLPKTLENLKKIRGFNHNIINNELAEEIISLLDDKNITSYVEENKPIYPNKLLTHILKSLLKMKAIEANIVERLIISRDDLSKFAYISDLAVMQGWRYELFGKDAEAVKNGKLAITIINDEVQIVR